MSSIGPLTDLVAHLRSELAALRGVAPVRSASAQATSQSAKPAAARGSKDSTTKEPAASSAGEDLASTLARRVAAIDPADPDRRRKAFRVFLESVLLDEWGPQLINDPGFYQLVANVHTQMEASAELRGLMDQAADRLLGPAGR